jgi:tetratricopeptide (TPR) repeat protein
MLGLFGRKTSAGKRSKLKASYDRFQLNPGEAESIAVARHLLSARRLNDAFRWVRKAKSHFPNAAKVDAFYRKVKKIKTQAALADARTKAKHDPSAASLIRVCELLRLSDTWNKAHRACVKTQKQFPDAWEIYLVLGRLFLQRFSTTKQSKHGWAAVAQLEKALELNPGEYRPMLLLALTLVRLDQFEDAVSVIKELLQISPRDTKASSLLAFVKKVAPDCVGAGRSAASESETSTLELVMGIPDAVGAFQFDENGEVSDTLSRENDVFDFSAPVEVVESMAGACHLDTHRLGLGDLVCCTLRGEGWNMGYRPIRGGSVLVFLEGEVSEEQIDVDMESALGEAYAAAL